ncbi:MAG: sigma-54-dependent Fis family transcriptional regulator [Mailhella sp.]|nr:sigma-54-dependent Fis family transcriptional regulator [Mailhella sp.]
MKKNIFDISNIKSNISDLSLCDSEILENGDFFQQASSLIFSESKLENSLEALFSFLKKFFPITYLFFTPPYEDQTTCHIYVNDHGVLQIRNVNSPSSTQMRTVMEHRAKFSQDKVFYIQANDQIGRLMKILTDDVQIESPCLYFYFVHEGHIQGSIYFGCTVENPFTEQERALLSMLWSPLFGVVRFYFQQTRLEKLLEMARENNKDLRRQVSGFNNIIGANSGLKAVAKELHLMAPFDIPILLIGETGTGKDIFAAELHRLSPRAHKPFIAVNCGGIAPSLIDSELFGYNKGAFTGALKDYKGRFERAQGGTLFLDEIGELPLEAQTRLLRVLQNRTVERLGGNAPIPVDFRLVCATNKDLESMVQEGTFREDLYFRLAGVTIKIPPLRERPGDIPLLIQHVLDKEAVRNGVLAPPLAPGEIQKLLDYPWPGNVRELINVVTEGFVRGLPDGPIVFNPGKTSPLRNSNKNKQELLTWADSQREYFYELLTACEGRISGPGGAAERAGLKPNTLRAKLDKLNISYGRQVKKDL